MNHITKTVLVCVTAVLLIITLASCALSPEDVAGIYAGSYTEDGSTFYEKITLTDRGTYGRMIIKDNLPFSSIAGRYEIQDDQILLYTSSEQPAYVTYRYSDEQLENSGNVFTKQEPSIDDSNELPQ